MKPLRQTFRHAPFWLAALVVYAFLLGPILAVILASFEAGQAYHFAFPPKTFHSSRRRDTPALSTRARRKRARRRGVRRDRNAAWRPRRRSPSCAAGSRRRSYCNPISACRCKFHSSSRVSIFLQFYNHLAIATGIDVLGTVAGLIVAHVFVTIPYSIGTVGSVLIRAEPPA